MSRRIDINEVLADPEERRELMIRTIIATQAREGIHVTREEAERAYRVIQEEIARSHGGRVANPGAMHRNDAASEAAAKKTFNRFHSRKPSTGVFPFHRNKEPNIHLEDIDWPTDIVAVGPAMRTLYRSDKWHKVGKTTDYFHDHDKRGVTFYAPADHYPECELAALPFDWPEDVMLIGECIGFVIRPDDTGEITEGITKGKNILVASPDGWVDPRRPNRVFLAIINLDGGGVEGIIDGKNLRITSHGIEG